MTTRTPLYLFSWPGDVGGASTKVMHLCMLLHEAYEITMVAPDVGCLADPEKRQFLEDLGIRCTLLRSLPEKLEGVGLGICDLHFFENGTAEEIKRKGLQLIWSNEMMWLFQGEAEAVKAGLIDKVHFVSELQRAALQKAYGKLPWSMPGNYIDARLFPFVSRQLSPFTIGRLSRSDMVKYPENFPVFYEKLLPEDVRFRVMAWDDSLRKHYQWHSFGPRWELLAPNQEPAERFLQSLDLFVYPLGHRFVESWGRSTVEAMLTGAIPLVSTGHQFHNLMVHEESGFICDNYEDYRFYANQLYQNRSLQEQVSRQCRRYAEEKLCNREEHLAIWRIALSIP